ncbi:hypothetical protein N2605_27060 [Bradyrhizobium yuanmingense]|uniref:hypothetical protein n=1 Tax=Bradyrhizobium yuanmingense TaxID=108015 RepID=UPI0021A7750E|nr:hypothetical protein N2605_27060 [Bradyrhizobium sp. CB1024]
MLDPVSRLIDRMGDIEDQHALKKIIRQAGKTLSGRHALVQARRQHIPPVRIFLLGSRAHDIRARRQIVAG